MNITFKIEYHTAWGESLALVLGGKKYPMNWGDGGIWSVRVEKCRAAELKSYGYIVLRNGGIVRSEWEDHCSAPSPEIVDSWKDCPIAGCPFKRRHQAEMFDRPGFSCAGVAVPVFALRSEDDFGIGEFEDLKLLVDWAASTGQKLIQLLPVNDTTRRGGWEDSYPYSPVSAFALHPLYIRLQKIGAVADEDFRREQAELNALREIDYPRVFQAKMARIRQAYEACSDKDLSSRSYLSWAKKNAFWLDEYAEFCARRDGLEKEYYCWMQWHLDKQFAAVAKYARRNGVSLKGDLPIGVSADSADAYWHPELFNLDSTAGAPPDYFSADGQNWGFPTYNWDAMARDDYAWWKARLRKMAEWFDAFRIDHILGFFRIWEIPVEHRSGKMGHFNPALGYSKKEIESMWLPLEGLFHEDPRSALWQPLIAPATDGLAQWQKDLFYRLYDDFFFHRNDAFWRLNALKKLPELLGASGMLACGEDLGMVPDCVPGVMRELGILSLKMRGMSDKGDWPALSVCATSSHDMPTLRMQCGGDPCSEEVGKMLSEYLASPSMLAVFPLQDWLALSEELRREDRAAERINEPADANHHWRYRMHLGLEALLGASSFCSEVLSLVRSSGR